MISERVFPNVPSSAAQARRYTLDVLGNVSPGVAENAAIMVSELVTNSLRHSAGEFTVTIDRSDDQIRIAVGDGGPGNPSPRDPAPSEPTGRGLRIVGALADSWGVSPNADGPGKVVWFTILAR